MLAANIGEPSAAMLRALLYSALSCSGADCSIEDAGRAITLANLHQVRAVVVDAWVASMAEPEEEEDRRQDRLPHSALTWGEAWARATSKHGLGLRDKQWLDMTPRQVAELRKIRLEQMQREELLVGILAATVENFSVSRPQKPATAEQFMLHKFPPEPELPIGDQIMAQMKKFRNSG